jgi:hypothetical protein
LTPPPPRSRPLARAHAAHMHAMSVAIEGVQSCGPPPPGAYLSCPLLLSHLASYRLRLGVQVILIGSNVIGNYQYAVNMSDTPRLAIHVFPVLRPDTSECARCGPFVALVCSRCLLVLLVPSYGLASRSCVRVCVLHGLLWCWHMALVGLRLVPCS